MQVRTQAQAKAHATEARGKCDSKGV